MAEYRSDVDIANAALQHCGGDLIDPVQGFTEDSKRAQVTSFRYGKCREAELRRNVWTFACRRAVLRAVDTGTMLLVPAMWASGVTYFAGSIAADQNGNPWISRIPNNLGNNPLLSPTWEPYFGPLTVSLYAAGISYFAGELVYTAAGDGSNRVYLSLLSGNEDNPATPTAYNAAAVYGKNQVVTYLSVAYMSLLDLNTANTPTLSPAAWDAATTYAIGAAVRGSDGVKYTSVINGNIANDPTVVDPTKWTNTGVVVAWTSAFTGGTGSNKWRQIGGAEFPAGVGLTTLDITYPLGTGPAWQGSTRNIYHLPAGFLRIAPQNPGSGVVSWLGGPSGLTYRDWAFENGFLLTGDLGPIPLRFVANLTDVSRMDPMFCEGLAARLGMEVCEPLTQSIAKLGTIAKVYDEWMSQARAQNAIEQGPDEPPDDDYVTCRL